jgi:hypothetical protein
MAGLSLRDLGTRFLKNLPDPERIFQLLIPGLPADFAPLRAFPGPQEVTIAPPAADLPPDLAAYSGTWEGAWGGNLQSRLVVEKIDANGAWSHEINTEASCMARGHCLDDPRGDGGGTEASQDASRGVLVYGSAEHVELNRGL